MYFLQINICEFQLILLDHTTNMHGKIQIRMKYQKLCTTNMHGKIQILMKYQNCVVSRKHINRQIYENLKLL